MLSKTGKISGNDHITNYLETKMLFRLPIQENFPTKLPIQGVCFYCTGSLLVGEIAPTIETLKHLFSHFWIYNYITRIYKHKWCEPLISIKASSGNWHERSIITYLSREKPCTETALASRTAHACANGFPG